MANCPKCGERVFKGENRCSGCGISFKWLEERQAATPPDSARAYITPLSRAYIFCSRCGAANGGGGIECIDGNPHTFQQYTHKPTCSSCGKIAGTRGECVLFHQLQHDFV